LHIDKLKEREVRATKNLSGQIRELQVNRRPLKKTSGIEYMVERANQKQIPRETPADEENG
ncbi:MAG: hypothetical protein K2N43_06755, partial [Lachnospiraceae bacterium]|nr:hypothetical protein [Lachnospiraceae bacterium]